jgi:TrmH RNA methyltransferase
LFVLDGIGNPHNLSVIARILAFLGFERLVISDYPEQAGLSAVACRVAEGGLEALDVYRATMLLAILKQLKPDYRVVGTALVPNGLPPESLWDDPRPVVLVLSNEEYGLLRATLDACDAVITLRGAGAVQSLNVSATAAIFCLCVAPAFPKDPATAPPGGFKAEIA